MCITENQFVFWAGASRAAKSIWKNLSESALFTGRLGSIHSGYTLGSHYDIVQPKVFLAPHLYTQILHAIFPLEISTFALGLLELDATGILKMFTKYFPAH